jgi:hypothetical protein
MHAQQRRQVAGVKQAQVVGERLLDLAVRGQVVILLEVRLRRAAALRLAAA